jgi:tetratricopeptide (TPR) repeat protein
LDGQRYFLNGVLFQKTLRWQEKTPDFIVVGVNTNNNTRRKLFFDDSKKFIDFLELELIAYIDKNYRTVNERLFFGWEMAGGLAFEILAENADLFTAYMISSPTHMRSARMASLKKKLMDDKEMQKFLYFTISPVEYWALSGLERISTVLKENASDNIVWEYESLKGENHHSTPTKTIQQGLSKFYFDYAYIRFYSLKEFDEFGGMDVLKAHYKKRGERYQISTDIHKDTKHFLLLQSMKEDNYESFLFFMKEFDGYYKLQTRDSWFNRYAQFYLKYENTEKAIEVFDVGLVAFPDSPVLLSGLGDAYLAKENTKKAKRYYSKAIKIATKNGDSNLGDYKSKLEKL